MALTRTYGDIHVCAPEPTKEMEKLFLKNKMTIQDCSTYDKLLTWLTRQPECRPWETFAAQRFIQEKRGIRFRGWDLTNTNTFRAAAN